MNHFDIQMTELYKTSKGCTYQCDLTDRICLQFGDIRASFKVRDFFTFRRTVKTVNIHQMIFNLSDDFDFEWIASPKNDIAKKLTLCEILQLRDLLDGTSFSLALNSMLHEALDTPVLA